MRNITRIGAFLTIVCIPFTLTHANQTIYQWTDKNGELHFSDQPVHGAEKRVLKEVQNYQAPKNHKAQQASQNEKDKTVKYSQVTFASPSDNATFRNASNTLSASLSIEPKLNEKHKIQFYLDDKPAGQPKNETNYIYQDVYRGTHTISASIINENGNVIESTKSITVFMHPPRVNMPKSKKDVIKVINSARTVLNTQQVTQ